MTATLPKTNGPKDMLGIMTLGSLDSMDKPMYTQRIVIPTGKVPALAESGGFNDSFAWPLFTGTFPGSPLLPNLRFNSNRKTGTEKIMIADKNAAVTCGRKLSVPCTSTNTHQYVKENIPFQCSRKKIQKIPINIG